MGNWGLSEQRGVRLALVWGVGCRQEVEKAGLTRTPASWPGGASWSLLGCSCGGSWLELVCHRSEIPAQGDLSRAG